MDPIVHAEEGSAAESFQANSRDAVRRRAKTAGLSLRKNFAWAFAGNGVYNGSQWLLIVVLAKLGSPEVVGRYTLALALTTPMFMFSNLNLASVLVADADGKHRFQEYLGLRIVCSTVSLVPILVALAFGRYALATLAAIALVTLSKYLESVSDITYGLMQRYKRLDTMACSLALRGLASVLVVGTIQYFTRSLTAALWGLCAVWAATMLLFDLPQARHWEAVKPVFRVKALLPLLWYALPLGVVGALASLGLQLPRYAMEQWRGERELGIFSAIVALGMVARMITVALSRSALPRLADQFAAGSIAAFRSLTAKLILIGIAVGLAGYVGARLFGATILSILYTREYASYDDVLSVVMLYVGVVAAFTFLGTAATAAQSYKPQVAIHLFKLSVIGGYCLYAVPTQGAIGAAWALLLGTLVSSLAYAVLLFGLIRGKALRVADASHL